MSLNNFNYSYDLSLCWIWAVCMAVKVFSSSRDDDAPVSICSYVKLMNAVFFLLSVVV